MTILIDNKSGIPIYDQIYSQIKNQIISGGLTEDEMAALLAPALYIGRCAGQVEAFVAKVRPLLGDTAKRAYEELEKEGFIYTVPGKGCYVARKNTELLREENLKKIEALMEQIIRLAAGCNLSREDILEMMKLELEDMA